MPPMSIYMDATMVTAFATVQGLVEKELKPKFEVSDFNVLLGRFDNTTINNCLHLSQAFGGNNADN